MTAVERRLDELRREFAIGERSLHELAARRDDLTTALLRVSGAIQVLEELLTAPDVVGDEPKGPTEAPWMTNR